jgi:adenylosuccinate lyase
MTASVQWMERTLDDSANRRISMPEGFLCADAILRLMPERHDGSTSTKGGEATCGKYLPFIATENRMMEAVKRGGNRQELHEIIAGSPCRTAKMKEGEVRSSSPAGRRARLRHERGGDGGGADSLAYIGRCPSR